MMTGSTARRLVIDIIAHCEQDLDTLHERVRTERNAKARDRARCVLLAVGGLTAPQIAERLSRSRRFVQRWCYGYRDHGLPGLEVKRQSGRPPNLSADEQQTFKQRVLDGPTDEDGVCTLRGADFQRILEVDFGVAYSLSGVYDLLHRLNLSVLKPRPKHRKTDPEAQQRWLDDAPFLSRPFVTNTPTSGSRCGSKMRRESASKAG